MESTATSQLDYDAAESSLSSPSFQGLLWTNWLTAINDNVIRWLVIGIGKDYFEPKYHGLVLMAGTACFVLPFLLLAAPAGYLADRFPKRNVIVACKSMEIVLMLMAWGAILYGNFWLLLFVVFLMGAQSALFSPSKMMAMPEMMGQDKISAANGYFNLATLTATVIGMALGGWLKDQTGLRGQEYNPFLIVSVTVGIAVMGTLVSLIIRKHPAANPKMPFPFDMTRQTIRDLQLLYSNAPLFKVSLGIVFFWAIAAFGQLNIDQFAFESGALTESNRTPLLVSLILGVGLGSVFAGVISAGRIELGIVPWGAIGIALFSVFLFVSPGQFINELPGVDRNMIVVCLLLGGLGASAGAFNVPLAAYLQHRSPAESRGAILSANNFVVFSAILLASLLFFVLRSPIYRGDFQYLPIEYQKVTIKDAKTNQMLESSIQAIQKEYESSKEPYAFAKRLPQFVPQHLLRAVYPQLIWIDMQFRRSIGNDILPENYAIRYPAVSKETIKSLSERLEQRNTHKLLMFPKDIELPELDEKTSVAVAAVLDEFKYDWQLWKRRHRSRAGLGGLGWTSGKTAAPEKLSNSTSEFEGSEKPLYLECDVFKLADDNIRPVILAHLVWTEMKERKSNEKIVAASEYYRLFPSNRQMMRIVKNVHRQVNDLPFFTSRQIFFAMALLTLPIIFYSVTRLPQAMVRIALWWVMKFLYRIKVNGLQNIPEDGSAVLVCNHSTYLDGLLMLLMSSRKIRMIASRGNFKSRTMTGLANFAGTILITGGPKSIQQGLHEARKALGRGELVGIFPEGGLTRSGQIQGFKPGLIKMLDQMPVRIIPVYIDQIWGSIFTYAGGKIVYKIPKRLRPPITINLGEPSPRPEGIHFIRQSVQELGADAVKDRQPPFVSPPQAFIRQCKKRKFKWKVGDSMGTTVTGANFLVRSLVARKLLRKFVLRDDDKMVGVLLPPSVPAVAVNMALTLDKRIAVNLNYTVSNEIMNACIKEAGIRQVLTSRKVMEKFDFEFDVEVVYIDDLRDKVTSTMKAAAAFDAYALPSRMLEHKLGLHQLSPDDVITVIFTSGSTGIPKGVMLTHRNIASNVEAIGQVINLNPHDTLIGVLPLFHSFGYTITMWGAMGLNVRSAYHFSPLEAKQVAKITQKYEGTVLLGTPTFLRSYLRRCTREELKTVNTVVAGAEKLSKELADAFENRFGIRPVEGYGATETAPLASVNVPPTRSIKNFQIDCKEGTVGRPIPNVAAKVTSLDDPTIELDVDQPGMLWIKGPNVMKGYLNRKDLTDEVIVDGWYKTGDVALIDKDGFIKITGRMSRFSKIGGEMIPHVQIEETILGLLDEQDQDEITVAVTAVPDKKKGERLIVLHRKLDKSVSELREGLSEAGLPNIYIPTEDSFREVDSIPLLGTGKLDLSAVKQVAIKFYGQPAESN